MVISAAIKLEFEITIKKNLNLMLDFEKCLANKDLFIKDNWD